MRPLLISLTPANQSSNSIALSQSPSGAGNLTLTATAAAIDSGIPGGRIVGITSSGNDSGITFTITGIDQNGLAATEVVTGSSGAPGTAVSTKFYKSISQIAVSGASAGTVTVGTVNSTSVAQSQMYPMNFYERIAPQVTVATTGTINYTVKETFDKILDGTIGASSTTLFAPTALSAQTSSAHAELDVGVSGIAIFINSYSNGATLKVTINHTLNFAG